MSNGSDGAVLFAYDGSTLAKGAIDEAGRLLGPGRDAVVLTVWQAYDLGFVPADDVRLDAANSTEVGQAAERTAAAGAALAESAGFHARSTAIDAAPAWKGIVGFADEHDACLIVLGSHGRTRLRDVVLGSVAGAVAAHSRRTVLIVHARTARV
ncbi:MAG: universal stress protein [Solirubrobacteraceae bacterium]